MAEDFSYQIEKTLGVISEGKGGWNIELNLISWGGRPAKYDIRSWSPDHQKMGKGITFTADEISSLKTLLNTLDFE
ncbi:MAG: PC4/YdbC family ssDNA-binding protein [Treponema sp.]|nr:PC4/YdbC family ssDNA-binding protein [Treponema sp.]